METMALPLPFPFPIPSTLDASARGGSPIHSPPRTPVRHTIPVALPPQRRADRLQRIRPIILQQLLWDIKEAKRDPTDARGSLEHALSLLDETEDSFGRRIALTEFRLFVVRARNLAEELEELEGDRNTARREMKHTLSMLRAAYSLFHDRVSIVDDGL